MHKNENKLNAVQHCNRFPEGPSSISNQMSHENSSDNVSMDLESLGNNDSIDELSSDNGANSDCSTGEPSIFSSSDSSSSGENSIGDLSACTSSQSPPHTSLIGRESERKPSNSTSSHSPSNPSDIYEEFIRTLPNVPSHPSSSIGRILHSNKTLISTQSQSTSYTSFACESSSGEESTITPSQITSTVDSIVPSSQITSTGIPLSQITARMNRTSGKRPISTQSEYTSDATFVYESSSGEESTSTSSQITSTDDSISSSDSPRGPLMSSSPRNIPNKPEPFSDASQPASTGGDKELESEMGLSIPVVHGQSSPWSTPEQSRDQRNSDHILRFCESINNSDYEYLAVSSENSVGEVKESRERTLGMNRDKSSLSHYSLNISLSSSNEDDREGHANNYITINEDKRKKRKRRCVQRSDSKSPIFENEGSNYNLDEAFVVNSQEDEPMADEEPEFSLLSPSSPNSLRFFLHSDEDHQAEIGDIPAEEEQLQVDSQPESSGGGWFPLSKTAKPINIPNRSHINSSPSNIECMNSDVEKLGTFKTKGASEEMSNNECMDFEIDDLETLNTNEASLHESRSVQSQLRTSFDTDSRVEVTRNISTSETQDPTSRERQRLKRQRSRCRIPTYKDIGFDNILFRDYEISSPESHNQDGAEEPIQRPRSAFNSLRSQPRSSLHASLRTYLTRSISNSREKIQNSSDDHHPSRDRSLSHNPCVSFIEHDVIEEVPEDEEDIVAEDRMEYIDAHQDASRFLHESSAENQDFDIEEEDVNLDPNFDSWSEIERFRNQTIEEQQLGRHQISRDSDSSRDGLLRSLRQITSPDGSPRPLLRPCPWSPSILSWSSPSGSWYGDEPFPDHFPRFSSNSSRDSPESVHSLVLSLEDQPQLATSNHQTSESFITLPQLSYHRRSPLSLLAEQSPQMPTHFQAASSNISPPYSSGSELRYTLSYVDCISGQSQRVSSDNESSASLVRSPQQSNSHQLNPLSSFREQLSPVSSNRQSSPTMGTPSHNSNSEQLREQYNPLLLSEDQPSQISSNRLSVESLNNSPQRSSNQSSLHFSPLSNLRKRPLSTYSDRLSSTSLNTPTQNSNSEQLRQQYNPLLLSEDQSSQISPNRPFVESFNNSPQHSSNQQSSHHFTPLSNFSKLLLRTSSDRESSTSLSTPIENSNCQEVRHEFFLSSLSEEHSQQIVTIRQSTASSEASSQNSNSPKSSHHQNSLSFGKPESRISSNQQSILSLSSHSRNLSHQETASQCNILSTEGSSLPSNQQEAPINVYISPCSETRLPSASYQNYSRNNSIRAKQVQKTGKVTNIRKRSSYPKPLRRSKRQATISSTSKNGSTISMKSTVKGASASSTKLSRSITHQPVPNSHPQSKTFASKTPLKSNRTRIPRSQMSSITIIPKKLASKTQNYPSTSLLSSTSNSTSKDSATQEQTSSASAKQSVSKVTLKPSELSTTQHQATISVPKQNTTSSVVTRHQSALRTAHQQSASTATHQISASTANHQISTSTQTSASTDTRQISASTATRQISASTATRHRQISASTATRHRQISASTATRQISTSTQISVSTATRQTSTSTDTRQTSASTDTRHRQILASTATRQISTSTQISVSTATRQTSASTDTRQTSSSTDSRQTSASPLHNKPTAIILRQQSTSTASQPETASMATQQSASTSTQQSGSTATQQSGSTATQQSGSTATQQSGSTAQQSGSTATQQSGSTTTQKQSELASIHKSKSVRRACTKNQVTTSQVKQVTSKIITRSRSVVQQSTSQNRSVLNEISTSSCTKRVSKYQTRSVSKKVSKVRKSSSSSKAS